MKARTVLRGEGGGRSACYVPQRSLVDLRYESKQPGEVGLRKQREWGEGGGEEKKMSYQPPSS